MADQVNFLRLLKADRRVKKHIFPNQDSIFQIKTPKERKSRVISSLGEEKNKTQ